MQTAAEGGNFHSKNLFVRVCWEGTNKMKKAHAREGFFLLHQKKVALTVVELWMSVTLIKFARGLDNHIILTF